jgi:hypothetical protein
LIEGFRGGLAELERPFVTGQDIGLYLRRRVGTYPPATQTPGVGVFELDDQGDIIIMLPTFTAPRPEGPPNALLQAQPPVATATLLAPPEVLDAAPAPPRSRDAHEVASRPTATQRARDREEPTSPWRRPIRAAVITKTFIAGVLAWMFVFNAIAIHEYASDGPSLYRPDGKTGTVHPDDVRLAASDAAWLVALGVAMITCYVLQRSGRFGRARRERGVAATAGRYALLCGSLALEALLTALSMTEGLADSIGAALGGSMLVGLVVAFVSYSFLTGFLAALRAK